MSEKVYESEYLAVTFHEGRDGVRLAQVNIYAPASGWLFATMPRVEFEDMVRAIAPLVSP